MRTSFRVLLIALIIGAGTLTSVTLVPTVAPYDTEAMVDKVTEHLASLPSAIAAPSANAAPPRDPFALPLLETFSDYEVLRDCGFDAKHADPYHCSTNERFWLNSGGKLYMNDNEMYSSRSFHAERDASWEGRAHTMLGNSGDIITAALYGAIPDADFGRRPQNIFRLFLRKPQKDVVTGVYFRVAAESIPDPVKGFEHVSNAVERKESNGLLVMARADKRGGDNDAYYGGVRVDGQCVIKKKVGGKYTTLRVEKVYDGEYDRKALIPYLRPDGTLVSSNLLPKDEWIGLKLSTRTITTGERAGQVELHLYRDKGWEGWNKEYPSKQEICNTEGTVYDDGSDGRRVLTEAGLTGLRTDFMDVVFDDFSVEAL